jgi:hypothetical protein
MTFDELPEFRRDVKSIIKKRRSHETHISGKHMNGAYGKFSD